MKKKKERGKRGERRKALNKNLSDGSYFEA